MNIKQLQQKTAEARNKANMTQIKGSGSIRVPTFHKWLSEVSQVNFDKPILDLATTLSEKLQMLLHGKNYIIENDKANEKDDLGLFTQKLEIQDTFFYLEEILFNHGVAHVIIEQIGDTKSKREQLRVANPNFPNYVARLGNIKTHAVIWSTYQTNKVKYYIRTTYTPETIKTDIFTMTGDSFDINNSKPVKINTFNNLLPKSLQVKGSIPNPYKFIPIVEVQYKATRDYSWEGADKIAPVNRIKNLQTFLNEGTKALSLELYLNRTKILADLDMLNTEDKTSLAQLAKENILGVLKDTGGIDGDNKAIEIIQGDPKVEQYWANITNIITLAISSLKLSELSEDQSRTSATGEIFNKGNDVETSNTLQIFRQKAIAEVLTKAFAMKQNETFEEWELDTTDWNIQLIPNVIMNEAKMTDIVVKQLGAGLINMVQAKVKLEGISQEDAETSLQQEDPEGVINTSLLATASFGNNQEDENNNDEEVDKETGNPQPENSPKG